MVKVVALNGDSFMVIPSGPVSWRVVRWELATGDVSTVEGGFFSVSSAHDYVLGYLSR